MSKGPLGDFGDLIKQLGDALNDADNAIMNGGNLPPKHSKPIRTVYTNDKSCITTVVHLKKELVAKCPNIANEMQVAVAAIIAKYVAELPVAPVVPVIPTEVANAAPVVNASPAPVVNPAPAPVVVPQANTTQAANSHLLDSIIDTWKNITDKK
jgi:hypothetical protein